MPSGCSQSFQARQPAKEKAGRKQRLLSGRTEVVVCYLERLSPAGVRAWHTPKMPCHGLCAEALAPARCVAHAAARPCALRRPACSGQVPRRGCQQGRLHSRSARCAVVSSSERAAATAAGDEGEELQIEGIDKKCAS